MLFVSAVLERWRGANSQRGAANEPVFSEHAAPRTLSPVEALTLHPSKGLDSDRFSLLKRPLR